MVASVRNHRSCAALMACALPILLGSTGLTSNFDERVLSAHNRERSAAGIAPLHWNPDLALSAESWARYLARTGRFEHAAESAGTTGPQGENLWAGTRGAFSAEAMVDLWIDEKKHFKPGQFPDNSRTGESADVGHYTQLMWRRTTDVGCALTRGQADDVLVCRYTIAGNVRGEKPF